jgi:hypothetical protein
LKNRILRYLSAMKKSDKEFWRELNGEPFIIRCYEVPRDFFLVEYDREMQGNAITTRKFKYPFSEKILNGPDLLSKTHLGYPDWLQDEQKDGTFRGVFTTVVFRQTSYSYTLRDRAFKLLPQAFAEMKNEVLVTPEFFGKGGKPESFEKMLADWLPWSEGYGFKNNFAREGDSYHIKVSGQNAEDSFTHCAFRSMMQRRR